MASRAVKPSKSGMAMSMGSPWPRLTRRHAEACRERGLAAMPLIRRSRHVLAHGRDQGPAGRLWHHGPVRGGAGGEIRSGLEEEGGGGGGGIMTGKLEKRVAVITAAGSGIGAATARRFAKEGARIVIGDLSGKRAEAVAEEIQSTGARIEWLKMDAADPDGAQALVWRALDAFGQIDVMVNNAGY